MTATVASQLRDFRQWAYSRSPVFGQQVDLYILQGQGLGDDTDLTDSLASLSTGLNSIAQTAQLSVADYLNAQTSINNMIAASRLGLTTGQYQQQVNATASTATPFGANILGVPLWLILGGAAVLIVSMKPSHPTRRR